MKGIVNVVFAPICQNPALSGLIVGKPGICVCAGTSECPNAPLSVIWGRRSVSIAESVSRAYAICARAPAMSGRAASATATSASSGVVGSGGSGSCSGSANGVSGAAPIRCASDSLALAAEAWAELRFDAARSSLTWARRTSTPATRPTRS
jgi:hypothetical protein